MVNGVPIYQTSPESGGKNHTRIKEKREFLRKIGLPQNRLWFLV